MNENKQIVLSDLYEKDTVLKLSNVEQMNSILNTEPNPQWVKKHPFIKNHYYLPIDKVELLLKRIFKLFRIEVLEQGQILNSVYVTVRVHYLHPVSEDWQYHDGIGACELQTMEGSGTLKLDMTNINRGAIPMALPIAKSYAIKDACDHLGTIFGANLNRKDAVAFMPDENIKNKAQEITDELTKKLSQ